MNNKDYTAPHFQRESFHCPHCNVYAQQSWKVGKGNNLFYELDCGDGTSLDYSAIFDYSASLDYWFCKYFSCNDISIWTHFSENYYDDYGNGEPVLGEQKMIYPIISTAPLANPDMPKDVKVIYDEARQIAHLSPRASAGLLRVVLEKLTEHLGETKGNLNTRIKNLNQKGLPQSVIKSLDIVRITANEGGAHAGQIDLEGKDNQDIVHKLFWLVNFIVEKTITEPNSINTMFKELPEDKRKGIDNRDKDINKGATQ